MILESIRLNIRNPDGSDYTGNVHEAIIRPDELPGEDPPVTITITTNSDNPTQSAIMKACVAAYDRQMIDRREAARVKHEEEKAATAEQGQEEPVDEVKAAEIEIASPGSIREGAEEADDEGEASLDEYGDPVEDDTLETVEDPMDSGDSPIPDDIPTMENSKQEILDYIIENGVLDANNVMSKTVLLGKIANHFGA